VGDVSLTVGDGFVSGTDVNEVYGYVGIYNWGHAGMGDLTVGDISLAGGDYASLEAYVSGYANESGSSQGNMTVGNVSFNAGETARVYFSADWYGNDEAMTVGDMTIGNIDVNVAQDSDVQIYAFHYIETSATDNVLGSMTVGDVTITGGDNSSVTVSFTQSASLTDSATAGSLGDMTIGDITVALSATSASNAGGSYINVDLYRNNWNADSITGGDFAVGDINLSIGDSGTIDLNVTNSGSYALMGDFTMGDVTLSVGDSASINAYVVYANYTTGDYGSLAFNGVDISLGDNSTGNYEIEVNFEYEGDRGDLSFGDVSITVGDSSTFTYSITIDGSTDGNQGDISVGNYDLTAGDHSQIEALFSYSNDDYNGDINSITIGDVSMSGGADTYLNFDFNITDHSDINNEFGDVTIGDITVTLGSATTSTSAASADYNIDITDIAVTTSGGALGDIVLGNITADLGIFAQLDVSVDFSVSGDAGSTTIGDINLSVLDLAAATVEINVSGSQDVGDMTVGDITLTVGDTGLTFTTTTTADGYDVGSVAIVSLTVAGDNDPNLIVGNITLNLEGASTNYLSTTNGDLGLVYLAADGDITIGDITITGIGDFTFDGNTHTTDALSWIAADAGGTVTIGDVDFSGYEQSASIDVSWASGAGHIIGSAQDDTITGNDDANIISGGEGADVIIITDNVTTSADGSAAIDTILTDAGDSGDGTDATALDEITGFTADEDLLDFNLVAGTAANTVVDGSGYATLALFRAAANDALNSTIKYFIADDGTDTWVAVNRGSGDADTVIKLMGVGDATVLDYTHIIA